MRSFRQHPYIREHPFAYCFAIGAALTGVVYIYQVVTGVDVSPVLALQPTWIQLLWATFYLWGGLLASEGIRQCKPRIETSGFALLAAAIGISVTLNVFVIVNYVALVSGGSIAVGCAARAVFLTFSSAHLHEVRPDGS